MGAPGLALDATKLCQTTTGQELLGQADGNS